jgi:hypothetical protein
LDYDDWKVTVFPNEGYHVNIAFKSRLRDSEFLMKTNPVVLSRLNPKVVNRNIIKVTCEIETVLYVNLKLKCETCDNKINYCYCVDQKIVPQVFLYCLARNHGSLFYVTIDTDLCLNGFYDFTPKEMVIMNNFLKAHGEYRYTVGQHISYTSPKSKVSALLNKITAKKCAYGYLCCSVTFFFLTKLGKQTRKRLERGQSHAEIPKRRKSSEIPERDCQREPKGQFPVLLLPHESQIRRKCGAQP